MTDSELAARLREVAVAGYERWRRQKGWGAIVTPTPHRLIDEIAAGFAPVLRELVETAVAHRLAPPTVTPRGFKTDPGRVRLEPIDLRPGKEAS